MKNYFFLFSILTLIISCQKEQLNVKSNKNEVANVLEKSESIENRIRIFKNKMKQINVQNINDSISYVSIEDAIWNIEAALNHDYADAGKNFEEMKYYTRTVNLELIGGNMTEKNLFDSYQLITAEYQNIIQNKIYNNNSHIVYIDIYENKENISENKNVISIGITVAKGVNISEEKQLVGTVDETDYWYPIGYGKCGPFEGENANMTGYERLEQLVIRQVNLPRGCYYTNIITNKIGDSWIYDIPLNPNDDVLNDNNRDYLLFVMNEDVPNYNPWYCMSPDDLRFYRDGLNTIIDNQLNLHSNHKFLSCQVDWNATACCPLLYWQPIQIRLGELHCQRVPM